MMISLFRRAEARPGHSTYPPSSPRVGCLSPPVGRVLHDLVMSKTFFSFSHDLFASRQIQVAGAPPPSDRDERRSLSNRVAVSSNEALRVLVVEALLPWLGKG